MERLKGLFQASENIDQPDGFYKDGLNLSIDEKTGSIINEQGNILSVGLPIGYNGIGIYGEQVDFPEASFNELLPQNTTTITTQPGETTTSTTTQPGETTIAPTTIASSCVENSPILLSKVTQVALVFLDGISFTVTLNGNITIPSSQGFNYMIGSIGVKLVTLDHRLSTMALIPSQIKVNGLNNDGFGAFAYKVINRDADSDLTLINNNHIGDVGSGDPNFWGEPASINPLGLIVSRSGDTVYDTAYSDPCFYLGWREYPVDQPNNRRFASQWSDYGKIVISFMSYGQNSGSPVI